MRSDSQGSTHNGSYPTMADIAKRCGVSRASVSRAFRNNRNHQSEETIQRILDVAREMGYDPNRYHSARRLASSKYGRTELNRVLGFFFFHFNGSESGYFMKMLQGVLGALKEQDFEIQTGDGARMRERNELPPTYRRGDIDGIVTTSQAEGWQPVQDMLRSEPNFGDRPVVGLVEPLKGCSAVYPDNYAGGRAAITHLLDLGHRRIAHFHCANSDAPTDVHAVRLKAYRDVLRERDLDPRQCLTYTPWKPAQREESRTALKELLASHPEITAVVAHDDQHAVFVHDTLRDMGLRVPEDISLISYDDTEIISDGRGNNILTTVHLPLVEIGTEGTLLLIRRVLGEETENRDIMLPTKLIVRRTTAPPRNTAERTPHKVSA